MPLYVKSLGIDIIGLSLLATSSGLGQCLFEWIWGVASSGVGRRILMVFSVFAMTAFFPLYALHGLLSYFIVLQFVTGAICAIMAPMSRYYISDMSPPESIGFSVSLYYASYAVGRIIGALVGTYIAQVWSFEYSFYASAFLSIVCAPVILSTLPKEKNIGRSTSHRNILDGLKLLTQTRSTGLLFIAAIVASPSMAIYSLRLFLPLYAAQQFGMSTIDIGILLSATSMAQLGSMPLLGWLSDRFGKKRTMVVGFGLASVLLLLYFLVGTVFQLLLISILVFVALSASLVLLAMIPDVVPATLYGSVIGIYGSCEDLSIMIGPLILGMVWSAYGPIYIFAATSVLQVVSVILVLAIAQMPRSDRCNA